MLAAAGRRADAARSAREGAAARAARLAAEAAALAPTEDRHPDAVLLGDGIEVLEGMERAVAAALGELADAPLVDSVPAGARALEGGASAAAVTRPVAAAAVSAPPLPGARPLASLITACPAPSCKSRCRSSARMLPNTSLSTNRMAWKRLLLPEPFAPIKP